jgi:hypothetical protein
MEKLIQFDWGSLYYLWNGYFCDTIFMDLMDWAKKLEILLLTGFAVAFIGGMLFLIFMGVDILLSRTRFGTIAVFIAMLIPALITTAICLLMIDNFTYTIFKFGVVSTDGVWRVAYGLGILVLLYYMYIMVLRILSPRGGSKPFGSAFRISLLLPTGLLVISSILVLVRFGAAYFNNHDELVNIQGSPGLSVEQPNILLIGGDGLNASNLSAYGYKRDTTPAIRDLALNSLVAENAFTNSAHSAGSVISIFTGKPPTKTHVLYPPDILKGRDTYQHLPGILRKIGYRTIEIGIPEYIDAFNMNMLDGFDVVNQNILIVRLSGLQCAWF